jgi:hypothetical protein
MNEFCLACVPAQLLYSFSYLHNKMTGIKKAPAGSGGQKHRGSRRAVLKNQTRALMA